MSSWPRVSLLVAMRNEARYIERCLRSILAQDYPRDLLEVWVLDGASTDESRVIAASLLEGRPDSHLVANPKVTQAAGWNLGLELCSGEVVGIVSAHSTLGPDYVTRAVRTLERTGADMVGGPMRAVGETPAGRAVALATSSRFGVGSATFHYAIREADVDTVFMGLCRREAFDRLGGFDEELIRDQDEEFSYRLRSGGGRIVCNPAIRSTYYGRSTLRSQWRQYFQYGLYKVRVIQKRRAVPSWRHLLPALFVIGLVASVAAAVVARNPLWAGVIVGPYVAGSLGASLWAGRRDPAVVPLLPAAFAGIHMAYGAGFLAGLWRWRGHFGPGRSRQPAERAERTTGPGR